MGARCNVFIEFSRTHCVNQIKKGKAPRSSFFAAPSPLTPSALVFLRWTRLQSSLGGRCCFSGGY